ncbi:MAG: response regulator [Bacteroidetes bacterium]|nr:response regulator [Bacteroidota bacterium]
MTILIVDDDADDLQFFTDAVAEIDSNVSCITAFNGIEALQVLEAASPRPDYIFLDLNMPKMGGKQCLRHIRNNPLFQSIPIIIYSTSRRPEDVEEVRAAGAAAFIVKPNKFHLLRAEIAGILNNRSSGN